MKTETSTEILCNDTTVLIDPARKRPGLSEVRRGKCRLLSGPLFLHGRVSFFRGGSGGGSPPGGSVPEATLASMCRYYGTYYAYLSNYTWKGGHGGKKWRNNMAGRILFGDSVVRIMAGRNFPHRHAIHPAISIPPSFGFWIWIWSWSWSWIRRRWWWWYCRW